MRHSTWLVALLGGCIVRTGDGVDVGDTASAYDTDILPCDVQTFEGEVVPVGWTADEALAALEDAWPIEWTARGPGTVFGAARASLEIEATSAFTTSARSIVPPTVSLGTDRVCLEELTGSVTVRVVPDNTSYDPIVLPNVTLTLSTIWSAKGQRDPSAPPRSAGESTQVPIAQGVTTAGVSLPEQLGGPVDPDGRASASLSWAEDGRVAGYVTYTLPQRRDLTTPADTGGEPPESWNVTFYRPFTRR